MTPQRSPPAARPTLARIEDALSRTGGQVIGAFRGLRLASAFQPIFSLAHRRAVGYEGLLRAQTGDGAPMPPGAVFDLARDEGDAIFLDRLCRSLHLRNFLAGGNEHDWLFLNVSPQVIAAGRDHGSFFGDLLKSSGMPPARVVVEILEGRIADDSRLVDVAAYYKSLGCLVAIDDFGAGHSNFDRIWKVAPHIVKLDRSMISQAAANPTVRRVLPSLVGLIHETGSLALMEGIETEEEALIALHCGVDLVQGYHFGRPAPATLPGDGASTAIDRLHAAYAARALAEQTRSRRDLGQHEALFALAAARVAAGAALTEACADLLRRPRADRCYLLDDRGRQLGASIVAAERPALADPRLAPLADGSGAIWARRPYFLRALAHPDEIQMTRPYLSVANACMCVTLSIALRRNDQRLVFCCDVAWDEALAPH